MNCGICGKELKRVTVMHLKSPFCKSQNAGKAMSLSDYQLHFGSLGSDDSTPASSDAASRSGSRIKAARKAVQRLRGSVDTISAAIAEIEAQEAELAAQRKELEIARDALQRLNRPAASTPATQSQPASSVSLSDEVAEFLRECGAEGATVREIATEVEASIGEVRDALENIRAQRIGASWYLGANAA